MELKIKKEELEQMSYTDITYMLLKETKKTMNTSVLFKNICELLELSDNDYSQRIGDYYTSLTIDKRFLMLENAEWDLTENHKVELEIELDDEESENDEEQEEDEEIEEETEDLIDTIDDEIDDTDDDTLDLSIVTEEELEEEN